MWDEFAQKAKQEEEQIQKQKQEEEQVKLVASLRISIVANRMVANH